MQLLDDMFYIAGLLNFSTLKKIIMKMIMKILLVWYTSILMQGKSQRCSATALKPLNKHTNKGSRNRETRCHNKVSNKVSEIIL